MEEYFSLLEPMEMTAKTGSPITGATVAEQRDECRRRYQAAVRVFTPDEQEALRWYVNRIVPLLADDYPLFARTPWSFVKVAPNVEGGLPHTRGPHIVLPEPAIQMLTEAKAKQDEWLAMIQFSELLLHEQCHVVQREHPDRFAAMYTQYWGFKHVAGVQGCPWLTRHQIVNPDGVDVNWIFPLGRDQDTRWIWPRAVLADVDDPARASFADVRIVAIELENVADGTYRVRTDSDRRPVMQKLETVSHYAQHFTPARNIEHPNEAAADLFARIVIAEKVLPTIAAPGSANTIIEARKLFAPLQQWFARILH